MTTPEHNKTLGASLICGETNFLNQEVHNVLKENSMDESRIMIRADSARLSTFQSDNLRVYKGLFGGRARKFVILGSVTSKFSPAGYLTELCREARNLHKPEHGRYLQHAWQNSTVLGVEPNIIKAGK